MKTLKWMLIGAVAGVMLLLVGCQSAPPTRKSEACQQAYEENRAMYDYAGVRPEICRR